MSPAEDPISPPRRAEKPVVLVVEDEIILRLGTASALRSAGFNVVEASNGGEAQTLILAGLRPDIVFADVSTPGMDGVALAQWLHDGELDVPMVLTSGSEASLTRAREACPEANSFLLKPYDSAGLGDRFRALIDAKT